MSNINELKLAFEQYQYRNGVHGSKFMWDASKDTYCDPDMRDAWKMWRYMHDCYCFKDHEIRELVGKLAAIGKQFGQHQSFRDMVSGVILDTVKVKGIKHLLPVEPSTKWDV